MSDLDSTETADPLLHWRDQFPILAETNYMVSHSLGAMPRGVYDSLRTYADTWATRGVRAWGEGWWDLNIETADALAPIIGAALGSLSIHQNVSLAMGTLLSCFDFSLGSRRNVVITDMIFPSVYYVLHSMTTPDLSIHTVTSEDRIGIDLQKLLDAIDEKTLFVCIDHVFFRSAYILDVQKVIDKAHSVGAWVILDTYHSAGIVPLSLHALHVDFAVGGVLKWMCGGPGGVFLYVRPDLIPRLRPKLTGWQAHQRPFAFEVEPIDYRDDAFRFLNGTPAIASLVAIRPGIDVIGQVGVDHIRAKSLRQTQMIIRLADEAGMTINSARDAEHRGGTVVLQPRTITRSAVNSLHAISWSITASGPASASRHTSTTVMTRYAPVSRRSLTSSTRKRGSDMLTSAPS